MWSEKLLIILSPGENSEWRGAKDRRLSLNLLAISTKWLLISECWCLVRESRCIKFCNKCILLWGLMRECIRWLGGSLCILSYDLLPSFWRWSLMGMSPAMASIPYDMDVLKAPRIHKATLLCIFPRAFRWYSWEHSYKTRAGTHIMRWRERKFYTEGTSEGDWCHGLSCQVVSHIWL